MRWFKHISVPLLIVAAAALAIAIAFSDHADDYGRVSLPAGGTVELPEGTVKVFLEEAGKKREATAPAAAVSFEVRPAGGGGALVKTPTATDGSGEAAVQRSTDLGSPGSVANIEVPAEGAYAVGGNSNLRAGRAYLTFGTDPATAIARRWRPLAALLGAAVLIALMPIPRRHRGEAGGPSGWSSDPTAPYARPEPPAPYAG
jgi:hypothetical protein